MPIKSQSNQSINQSIFQKIDIRRMRNAYVKPDEAIWRKLNHRRHDLYRGKSILLVTTKVDLFI